MEKGLSKRINRARVLNAMRVHAPVSRTRLAELTGLDKKSITNFCNELMAEGLVEDSGAKARSRGRPFNLLQFVPGQAAIGIVVEPDRVSGALVDFEGSELARYDIEFPLPASRRRIASCIRRAHGYLARRKGVRIHGTGVVMPAVIDPATGRVRNASNLPGANGLVLPSILGDEVTVLAENSSNARALAEKWFGAGRSVPDFVCVELGIGVGAGIVIDRRLYRGAGRFSGELGHLVIEPGGRRCVCGKKGCLEAYVSERVLRDEAGKALRCRVKRIADVDPQRVPVRRILRAAGYRLGVALASVANLLNPGLIILNGDLAQFGAPFLSEVRRGMTEFGLPDCLDGLDIRVSGLDNASILGAASLVFGEIFEVAGHYYV